MEKSYQDLIAQLAGNQNVLLTTLISGNDPESWEESKYIVVSHTPLLTLEMAVNRVCFREKKSPPSPAQIYAALEYAKKKSQQYINSEKIYASAKHAVGSN